MGKHGRQSPELILGFENGHKAMHKNVIELCVLTVVSIIIDGERRDN